MPDRPIARQLRSRLAFNVKQARSRLGLSQEALAEIAGLGRTYISEVERKDRNVTLDVVERLAVALRVDALDLLRHEVN